MNRVFADFSGQTGPCPRRVIPAPAFRPVALPLASGSKARGLLGHGDLAEENPMPRARSPRSFVSAPEKFERIGHPVLRSCALQ